MSKLKGVLRRAGFRAGGAVYRLGPTHANASMRHARMGSDAATSVLDPYCRAWDHKNLFVVDAGFLPSSAEVVNPALTIAPASAGAARRRPTDITRVEGRMSYDYIITGAGPAGCSPTG